MDSNIAETIEAPRARPETLARLQTIWTRILRVPAVTPESDFFDLGGDSLMAVGLLLEIEQETGVNLPVTTIYDAPTIALLAELIDGQAKTPFSPLVKLKDGNGTSPLFIVHGVGGTVIELSQLGKLIEHDSPVYALQARGLDGSEEPLHTVADMADYYVAAIRTVQPHGPYFLSGYSFGGLIAVEMARRLKSGGETIDLLLLIDAYAHPKTWPARSRLSVLMRRVMDRLRRPIKLRRASTPEASNQAANNIAKRNVRRWLQQILVGLPPELQKVCLASEEALDRFWPRYYPDRVVFVHPRTPSGVFPSNPTPIWQRLVQKLEIHSIPGDHLSVLKAHAPSTAAEISACIAQACNAAPANLSSSLQGRRPSSATLEARPC